jgi:hypothetical protein
MYGSSKLEPTNIVTDGCLFSRFVVIARRKAMSQYGSAYSVAAWHDFVIANVESSICIKETCHQALRKPPSANTI